MKCAKGLLMQGFNLADNKDPQCSSSILFSSVLPIVDCYWDEGQALSVFVVRVDITVLAHHGPRGLRDCQCDRRLHKCCRVDNTGVAADGQCSCCRELLLCTFALWNRCCRQLFTSHLSQRCSYVVETQPWRPLHAHDSVCCEF